FIGSNPTPLVPHMERNPGAHIAARGERDEQARRTGAGDAPSTAVSRRRPRRRSRSGSLSAAVGLEGEVAAAAARERHPPRRPRARAHDKGQEILTADKVAIRVSIITNYQVVDPRAAV